MDNEFGLYELEDFLFCYNMEKSLEAAKEAAVNRLYEDYCVPSTVQLNELGNLVHVTQSVEDIALMIIDEKNFYDKKIQRYSDKSQLFEQAVETLTEREKDVIYSYYFHKNDNKLGLSEGFFHQLRKTAEEKLCSAICELRSDKKKEWRQIVKQERIKQVQEWKQAN